VRVVPTSKRRHGAWRSQGGLVERGYGRSRSRTSTRPSTKPRPKQLGERPPPLAAEVLTLADTKAVQAAASRWWSGRAR